MQKSINYRFSGGTASTTPISSYNQTKVNLGSLMRIYTGSNPEDKFVGPMKIGMARPMEQSTSIVGSFPHVIQYSSTIDWVFLFDNAGAAATRRIVLYEYNKITSDFNWKGFVTLTYPTATTHTIRGARMIRTLYTTGTIAASGTALTGTSTAWTTDKVCVGSRIGFGSTDPTQITIWYEVSVVGSNTSITLVENVGTISAGTSYVIEDLMSVMTTTNATTTNGGLFVVKGLRYELFNNAGTAINAAVSTDGIRAVYWIADASTVINTAACGCSLGTFTAWNNQLVYVIDTNRRVYVYNFRKTLTLSSGKDTGGTTITTGIHGAFTGTISQANNGRIGTLLHGPGSGAESLYFVTTTRVYRADLTLITAGSTTWSSDTMVEVPPGGANTYPATSLLSSIEIADTIDRLIIMSTGAAGVRSYVTRYNTISSPFDHIFLCDDKQLDQSTSDSGGVPHPAISIFPFSIWSEGGILYLARMSTVIATCQIYTLPLGAHRYYALTQNQMVITPRFDVSDSSTLYNVYVSFIDELGTDTFSLSPEPFNLYYRTSGISDNSGGWTLLDSTGSLSGISAIEIQFGFTFKIIGTLCIPARILGLSLTYEDKNTDSHYEPSVTNSSIPNRIFAYRQSSAWNSTIPTLRIRLTNADTGASIIDDNTVSASSGTWQYSTNGGNSWSNWNSAQDAVGNYIRYIATSLPDNVKVRALLTQ